MADVTSVTRDRLRTGVKSGLRHGVAVAGRISERLRSSVRAPRVLCYHGVCEDPPDEWSVTPEQLRAHMAVVRDAYVPVSLDAVVGWLRGEGTVAQNAVAVTFDDGFVDVLEHAAPILSDAGVPGTAFISTGLVGGADPDVSYRPTRPIMGWSEVGQLAAAGWGIGSHSFDHAPLARLDDARAESQLVRSKAELEQRLGVPITILAYPYGTAATVSARDQRLAEQVGYRAAFMDMTGAINAGADPWSLPRSKVLGTDRMLVVRASLDGAMDLWRAIESRH